MSLDWDSLKILRDKITKLFQTFYIPWVLFWSVICFKTCMYLPVVSLWWFADCCHAEAIMPTPTRLSRVRSQFQRPSSFVRAQNLMQHDVLQQTYRKLFKLWFCSLRYKCDHLILSAGQEGNPIWGLQMQRDCWREHPWFRHTRRSIHWQTDQDCWGSAPWPQDQQLVMI